MDDRTPDLFMGEPGDDAPPIERHASQAYLSYAVSTVKARALPHNPLFKPTQDIFTYGGLTRTVYAEILPEQPLANPSAIPRKLRAVGRWTSAMFRATQW